MKITEKNKQEIEKIKQDCGNIEWCLVCQEGLKERIKTSIEWCEAWIKTITLSPLKVELKTHLNWLKKQEKKQ